MVVAQLVERLLPTPEVRGSIPVIGEILFIYSLSIVLKRRKKERPTMVHFLTATRDEACKLLQTH